MQNIRVLFQDIQLVHGYFALSLTPLYNKTQSFDWASLYQVSLDNMAEKEGFEPSRQLPHPTPLAERQKLNYINDPAISYVIGM